MTARKDPVVMRLIETQAWVGDHPAVLLNRAIQVNEQSALGVIGQFGIDYFPAYQKLHLHRVAVLRGGKVLERTASVNTRLLERETGLDAGMYGGAVTLQLLLDDMRVGDTVWMTYTVEGSNPVFGKQWSDGFSWDAGIPIERRSLTVFHPAERPLYWRQLGDFKGATLAPAISRQAGTEKLRFDERALEALESEESVPAEYQAGRSLQMSEHADWHSVAVWASGLFPQTAPGAALSALAQQFRQEATPAAQASAALRWVQDEIRYFSVSIGENSHRPQSPDTVLKLRYGDCKDKSYLLVSLLRQLGIEARPVLINAQAPRAGLKMLASPNWFDHVIVQFELDGRRYHVDPTASGQKVPLDTLSTAFAGGIALVVDPSSRSLTVIPERTDVGPEYEHVDRLVIASFDGDAVLEAREIYRGRYAEAMRVAIPRLSGSEFGKSMLERYESLYPGVTLAEAPRFVDLLESNVFEMQARYTLPKPLRISEASHVIDYESHIVEGSLQLPRKIVRNYPLALPRGKYVARYRMQVQWPDTVRRDQPLTVKSIDNPFFALREELNLKGNVLDYMLDYRVKQATVAASEVPALQAQSKLLPPYMSASFRLPVDAVSKPELVAMSLSLRELDVLQSVGDAHALLHTADKLKDTPDAIGKVCDLAVSAFRLRDMMPGDGENIAGKLKADLGTEKGTDAALCLARILFLEGRFSESVASFHRAALKEDSAYRRDLAWAQAYAGDGGAALATMAAYRVARTAAGSPMVPGLDLADEMALAQRAGKPVPDEILQLAREIPDGVWPRPLLAMQAGVLDADALLKLIDTFPEDKRALALNDTWFYVGQRQLLANDTLAARRAFLWYGVDGLRSHPLHAQALAELNRLDQQDENYRLGQAAFERGDFLTAIASWRASAEAGFPAAQLELGLQYQVNGHLPLDYRQSKHSLELAAASGNARSMNALGYLYEHGLGMPIDLTQARSWYAKGAELGDANAASNLGLAYLYGRGIDKDWDKAFFYFRLGAERNSVTAQGKLAAYYLNSGKTGNYPKALRWASRAAKQGDEDSMLILAKIYEYGYGVPVDEAQAAKLYQLLDKDDYPEARVHLGFLYEIGRGVPQDLAKAVNLYTLADKAGNATASLRLGWLSMTGEAGSKDMAKAVILLEKAANGGEIYAYNLLANIYSLDEGIAPDLSKVSRYLLAGAEKGNSLAQASLGGLYHFGKNGLPQDYVQAAAWYQQAIDNNELFALNNLGDLYEKGLGVPQDYARAVELYRRAAIEGYPVSLISLSELYEKGLGVQRNPVLAYTYCKLSLNAGRNAAAQKCVALSATISPGQVDAADAYALAWKKNTALPAAGDL